MCTQVQVKQTLYLFIAIYKYNLIWTEKRNILSISFRLALWNQKTSWHSLWLKSRQMSRPLCNIFLTCPCVLCPSSNKAAKWITIAIWCRVYVSTTDGCAIKWHWRFPISLDSRCGLTISSITRVPWHILRINRADIKVNMEKRF